MLAQSHFSYFVDNIWRDYEEHEDENEAVFYNVVIVGTTEVK